MPHGWQDLATSLRESEHDCNISIRFLRRVSNHEPPLACGLDRKLGSTLTRAANYLTRPSTPQLEPSRTAKTKELKPPAHAAGGTRRLQLRE